ncbi:helix-turn-helix transcriptional regulator [Ponticoccus litoralis]|uniref:Helix-turn-helix domain-containing protein n=1 Tax=Ponticoccus litoralis TaxID=422297 RepID=A0AAW9SVA7_9RHOB
MPITLDFPPRLMPAPQAAHYIGVSASTLYGLPIPRKILGGKRLYDRRDLDAYADGLAIEGESEVINGGW